jgi:hypothetical protein
VIGAEPAAAEPVPALVPEPVPAAGEPEAAGAAAEVTGDAAAAAPEAAEVTPEAADVGVDGTVDDDDVVAACAWRENTSKKVKIPAATIANCTARRAMRREIGCGMKCSHVPGNLILLACPRSST